MSFEFGPEFFVGAVFGLFGMAYFSYGKKQKHTLSLVSGIGLMVYPYFVSGVATTVLTGIALLAAPFVLARYIR
jgi:hypothetical protein